MTFLALNGQTIPCLSPGADEDAEEHGLDRARMFDGTMRMTRRGLFRKWTFTTRLLDPNGPDYAAIRALMNTNNPPLLATGDLVESTDGVYVMPIPGKNTPVMTGSGLRRRISGVLEETPGIQAPDRSANVFLFLREGTNLFQNRDGTGAASAFDLVRYWGDARDNGRAAVGNADVFSYQPRGTLDGTGAVFCGISSTGYGASFTLPDMHTFTGAAILVRLKTHGAVPSDSHLWLMNRDAHQAANTLYPDTVDGHIKDSWGTQDQTDFGLATDLDSYNVYEVVESTDERTARLNGDDIYHAVAPLGATQSPFFSTAARLSGSINTEFFDGTIQRLVILEGDISTGQVTPSQLQSWRDYMSGLVSDPPIA
jgi:hypothetical protein